jgi:thioredoxin 1
MAQVQELNDQTFAKSLRTDTNPVLVDFSATWCGPCKALAPTIDALAKEFAGRLRVYKVDIDQAADTAAQFGIGSVPTCIFFKDGKEVDRFFGNQDLRSVRQRIEKVLA